MPIKINQELCVGCGACVAICPANFRMNDDGKSEVIDQDITDQTKEATDSCPVQAITIA